MAKKHHPRRGSLQFWPHARSSKHAAAVRTWADVKENKALGFIGYKVGMTHVLIKEENPNSHKTGMEVFTPVTVIECPPLKVYSVRYHLQDEEGQSKVVSEIFSKKIDKEMKRKTGLPKKNENTEPEAFDRVTLSVYTQPKLTGIGKKKPDLVELEVGGKDLKDKSTYAQSLLDKEIKVSEVFKEAQFMDVHSVTKGQGFTGVIKKSGVKLRHHKSEKGVRCIGTLGSWTPKSVQYTVTQPGKWGYHLRTEYNKTSIKVGDKPEEINPKGGFIRYGLVKNDYILIKGSIAGATKRPITFTAPIRVKRKMYAQPIKYISLESKQK
ncbi:MAG: 50S ribosomal protein L3 [Nanoarchaeota archaeon]|nr:50S ribosomal protein L3 [Nanoarchaeota archaeon]